MIINSASVPAPFAHHDTKSKWRRILGEFKVPGQWTEITATARGRWSQAINNYANKGEFSIRKSTNGGYIVVYNGRGEYE